MEATVSAKAKTGTLECFLSGAIVEAKLPLFKEKICVVAPFPEENYSFSEKVFKAGELFCLFIFKGTSEVRVQTWQNDKKVTRKFD